MGEWSGRPCWEEHDEPVYWEEERGGRGGGGGGGGGGRGLRDFAGGGDGGGGGEGGQVGGRRRRLLADPVKLGHVIDRERACMHRLEDVGIIRMMP